ncbi:DNA repair protein SWI5 homolog [Muntiacus reevesi]|uniref:DNA repair protein SWI5 homolog n=1 Tax=Muntiacus reevesi TaxID=9886 RepID=UPI003306D21A
MGRRPASVLPTSAERTESALAGCAQLRFVTFLVSVTGFQVPGRPEEILFRPRPGPSFSAVPPQSGAPDARAEEDSTRTFQKLRRGLPIPCFREETAFLSFVSVTPDPTKVLCLSSSLTSPQVRPSLKPGQVDRASEESLHLDVQKLKEKKDMLDKEITQLFSEGYSVDELEDHISQLHEYNDIKDVAQMLLGRLAVIRGVTTKDLYPEFGLDMND